MFSLKQHGPCGRRSERIAVVIRPADDGTILVSSTSVLAIEAASEWSNLSCAGTSKTPPKDLTKQ